MFYVNIILLSTAVTCFGKFSFSNQEIVRKITIDVSTYFRSGCITVLRPSEPFSPDYETVFLSNLTASFVKNDGVKFQSMSYTLKLYLGKYLDVDRVNEGSCFKWTTVVMVNNSTNFQLQQLEKSRIFSKSLWLLFANESVDTLFENVTIRYDSFVGLIQQKTEKLFMISEAWHVQKGMDLQIKPCGFWSVDHGLEKLNFDHRLDWSGAVFRAGAHENWPVTTFIFGSARTNSKGIDGYFPCVWFELEQMLNFSTIIVASLVPGREIAGGNWSGLIGLAMNNEIDAILSEMDFSVNRVDAIKHLTPILRNSFQVFFSANGYVLDLLSIFRPFHYTVWLILIGWVLIGGATLYLICKIGNHAGINSQPNQLSLIHAIYFLLQTLAQQGSSTVPKVWAQRVLFLVSYLVAAVILPSYSASLISSLTVKTPAKPFDSLLGILKTDYKLLVPGNSSYYDYFATSADAKLQEILRKHVINDMDLSHDMFEMTRYICEHKKSALFNHGTYLELDIYNYGLPLNCELQSLSRPVSEVFQSMAFPKQSPYHATFNLIILRMMETGLLQRQRLRYMTRPKQSLRADPSLKLTDLAAVFVLFFSTLVLSIVILIFELSNCFQRR